MDFESVVSLYYEDLYRFAFSLARNRDAACDLTQQTYAVYAEKRRQIRDSHKIKTWLFTTLYREFLRLRQRDRRLLSIDDEATDMPEQVADSDTGRSAEHAELLEILASLEDGHCEILTLFYLHQHSYKDIAEILEVPIGTVMSRLSRAKGALRKKIDASAQQNGITMIPIDSNQKRPTQIG
jgi:RNA polymerase sigma-70 factor (ECF subfamily)